MYWVVTVWALIVAALMLNATAAGVVAVLHVWRSKLRTGPRTLVASAVSAFLPTSFLVVVSLLDGWGVWESEWLYGVLTVLAIEAVGTAVSFPGAMMVARKLDAPGNEYRSFE